MPKRAVSLRCPTCRKIVFQKEPEFPFCSERCRTIDLGKWASGGYVISTPITEPDEFGDGGYAARNPDEQSTSTSMKPRDSNRRNH